MPNIKTKEKGFTLLETIVAIFIILISITGPMAIAQSGLRAAYLSRDQIAAFYLAQDALEFVKNSKDQWGLDYAINPSISTGWLDGVSECTNVSECVIDTIDINDPVGSADPILANNKLYFDPSTGQYQTDNRPGFNESIFYRVINIEEIQPGAEAKVTVTVGWQTNPVLGSREIVITEYITNWAKGLND